MVVVGARLYTCRNPPTWTLKGWILFLWGCLNTPDFKSKWRKLAEGGGGRMADTRPQCPGGPGLSEGRQVCSHHWRRRLWAGRTPNCPCGVRTRALLGPQEGSCSLRGFGTHTGASLSVCQDATRQQGTQRVFGVKLETAVKFHITLETFLSWRSKAPYILWITLPLKYFSS